MAANGFLVILIGYVISQFVYIMPSYAASALILLGVFLVWKREPTAGAKYAMGALTLLVAGNLAFTLYYSQGELVIDLRYVLSLFVLNVIQLAASIAILTMGIELLQAKNLEEEVKRLERNRKLYLWGMVASLTVHLVCTLFSLSKGILWAAVTVVFLYLWFLLLLYRLYQRIKAPENYGAKAVGEEAAAFEGAAQAAEEKEEDWEEEEDDGDFFATSDEFEDEEEEPREGEADPILPRHERSGRQGQPLE